MKTVQIGGLTVGNDRPLTVIAGPCQLESADHAQMIAGRMAETCAAVGARFIFKASYDKANRTSLSGKRGVGVDAGLKILADLRAEMGIPVLTLAGQTVASRVGVAVLKRVELDECIVADEEDYLRRAVELANDLPRLAQLRRELRQRVLAGNASSQHICLELEAAYRQIWRRWCEAEEASVPTPATD